MRNGHVLLPNSSRPTQRLVGGSLHHESNRPDCTRPVLACLSKTGVEWQHHDELATLHMLIFHRPFLQKDSKILRQFDATKHYKYVTRPAPVWRARIEVHGISFSRGGYKEELEAVRAVDRLRPLNLESHLQPLHVCAKRCVAKTHNTRRLQHPQYPEKCRLKRFFHRQADKQLNPRCDAFSVSC